MMKGGFWPILTEWWHFNGANKKWAAENMRLIKQLASLESWESLESFESLESWESLESFESWESLESALHPKLQRQD